MRSRSGRSRRSSRRPEDFPYTIRIVSETLESNGSSSMGSVCGSTLALMDAGVPIKAPVSGIAMGLVKEGDDYVILTDIQGAEDHLGDMDFKVAGTPDGITALQMDIKITGVTQEIMRGALEQAARARASILEKMLEAIPEPRVELADHAPRITTVKIDPEQIGLVIGKGGETIRSLEGDYDVQIDIEEDGTILIYATEGTKSDAAIAAIKSLTKEPEVGDTYTGKVVKTTDFGAFVELKKGTDGLLHVSNVGPGRVKHIEDVITRGDVLDVLVQEVDKQRGRIGLKLIAKHENGSIVQPEELVERAKDAPDRPREERPPRRDGDRGRGGRGGGRDRAGSRSDVDGGPGAAPHGRPRPAPRPLHYDLFVAPAAAAALPERLACPAVVSRDRARPRVVAAFEHGRRGTSAGSSLGVNAVRRRCWCRAGMAAALLAARLARGRARPGPWTTGRRPCSVPREDELLVKPGDHPHFSNRDPGNRLGLDKHEGRTHGEAARADRAASAAPLRRGQAQPAARAAGPRRLGQGRRHPQRLHRREPAGRRRAPVPRAVGVRARARLPLARARGDARAG